MRRMSTVPIASIPNPNNAHKSFIDHMVPRIASTAGQAGFCARQGFVKTIYTPGRLFKSNEFAVSGASVPIAHRITWLARPFILG